jgi:hypothetical protein
MSPPKSLYSTTPFRIGIHFMRSFSHFVKITGIGIVLAFGLQGCGGGNGSGNQYEVPVMAPVATNPAGETRVDNIKSVQADTT